MTDAEFDAVVAFIDDWDRDDAADEIERLRCDIAEMRRVLRAVLAYAPDVGVSQFNKALQRARAILAEPLTPP